MSSTDLTLANLTTALDTLVGSLGTEKVKTGTEATVPKKDRIFDVLRLWEQVTPSKTPSEKTSTDAKTAFEVFRTSLKTASDRWTAYKNVDKADEAEKRLAQFKALGGDKSKTTATAAEVLAQIKTGVWKPAATALHTLETALIAPDGFIKLTYKDHTATAHDAMPTIAQATTSSNIIWDAMIKSGYKVGCCKATYKKDTAFAAAKWGSPLLLAVAGASVALTTTTRSALPVEMQSLAACGAACALAASAAFVAVSRNTAPPDSKSDLELQLV